MFPPVCHLPSVFTILSLTTESSSILSQTWKFSTSSSGLIIINRGKRSIPGETSNNTSKELATKYPKALN